MGFLEDFNEIEPVVSNSFEVDLLLKNILEICQYYKIIHAFGYNENTQQFLRSSYETFYTFDFSQCSQQELENILRNKSEDLMNQLDAAYEGWFKDTFAKIAYNLKSDSDVSKKIADKLVKIKTMSDAELAYVLHNKLGFEFYTPENILKMISYLEAAVTLAVKNESLLKETQKNAISRSLSKTEVKNILDKVRSESEELVMNYRSVKSDAMNAKRNLTDEDVTPASQGWSKDKVISVIQKWLDTGAGKLSKLKLILNNVEKWGYNFKLHPQFAMNSNGDHFPIVELESIAKDEFRDLIVFIHETLNLYSVVDSAIYRFVKKF